MARRISCGPHFPRSLYYSLMDVIAMLSQAMELPEGQLTGTEMLSDIDAWDSLALLNFMALVDTNCGITLSPEKLLRCESIREIEALINNTPKP